MIVPEKLVNIKKTGEKQQIVVTHITIRQSISFLLLRLVILECIAALIILLFHFVITSTNLQNSTLSQFNIPLIIFLVILKISLVIFIVVQWVNEYYEITPTEVIHNQGFIFKKEQRQTLDHLSSLEIEQGILGRIFNYGTIKCFNWATEKPVSLYLIHNPMKYHRILQTLLPSSDREKDIFREHLLEPADEKE